MTKCELVSFVAEEVGITLTQGAEVVEAVLKGISKGINEDGEVIFKKFGTFSAVVRPPRKLTYAVAGGGTVQLPARKACKFKPSSFLVK